MEGVGRTAIGAAQVRAAESRRPDRLFDDPFAAHFVAAAGDDAWNEADTITGPWAEIIQGMVIWTRYFDDFLLEAATAGCRQVVLLAAGLDMRAFRLPWPDGVRLFELDRTDVVRFKEQVIAEHGHHPTCQRAVVTADLSDDWHQPLLGVGLDETRATAWLAEGVLVYLDSVARERMLHTLTRSSVPGCRLGFDHLSQARLDELHAGVGGNHPRAQQTAAMWRSGLDEPPEAWLARHGWIASLADAGEQARRYGRAGTDSEGRPPAWLVTAERR